MKKLFSASYNDNNIHIGLLVLRIAIGILMLVHGVPKMLAIFSGEPIQFPAVFGLSPGLSISLAVFAEVICSVMLIIGGGKPLPRLKSERLMVPVTWNPAVGFLLMGFSIVPMCSRFMVTFLVMP